MGLSWSLPRRRSRCRRTRSRIDELVDTTGCGDAFSAGFLRGLSLGWDRAAAARLGCATAAQVARGLGTDAGAYDLAAVTGIVQDD